MFIDSHSHLNFKAFTDDYLVVAKRAKKAGVNIVINIGAAYDTSQRAVKIAQSSTHPIIHSSIHPAMYAAVGLHPIHVKDEKFESAKFLELARLPEVVAIGETGFDFFHSKNIALQREVFLKSIKLANQLSKPVILHCRDAFKELYSQLVGLRHRPPGVLHFFSEGWPQAKQILDLSYYLGFTGAITFIKDPKRLEVIEKTPLDKMLIETDCPFVVPEPYKSQGVKRCEPAYVVEVAKKIAEIKKIPLEKVAQQTTTNAKKLFGI